MKKPLRITPEVQIVGADGKPTRDGFNVLQRILDNADEVLSLAVVEDWPVLIPVPDNQSYTLVLNCSTARTITKVTTKCASGSCTVTIKINSTALGGTANSATSTEQEQAHATDNVMTIGDDLVATISANSSCRDLSINIHTTRTLTDS